jgi:pimeloyl-ACP methyl ester carboxylesterase
MTIVLGVLQVVGLVVVLFAVYLLIVSLVPGMSVPKQPLEKSPPSRPAEAKRAVSREDVSFEVEGMSVRAWLYLPENPAAPVPCIVMGNGFGGTRDMGLEAYAARFQEAGFAVLAFDYRHFGDSDGEPRQLVWIPYQLQDYSGAIDYARGREEIDSTRVALWGTSLSGGHVIVLAAKDPAVACVVAQCPGLDGRAMALMGLKTVGIRTGLRMLMYGQRDLVRSWFGLSPLKIPIVGRPGTIALMTTAAGYEGFRKLAPPGFVNEVCARINIRGDKYRPVTKAGQVRCPVLLQICENDDLTPISAAEDAARRLGTLAVIRHYPIGHFDIYFGRSFEKSVNDQLDFFRERLA